MTTNDNIDMEVTTNPFTPKSGMPPRYLVGREKEIAEFTRILDRSIKEAYHDHFIVLGEWGTGKTSLFKEFQSIAQMKGVPTALITTRNYSKDERELDGIVDLVEQLPQKLPIAGHTLKNFIARFTSIGVQVVGTGIQVQKETLKQYSSPLMHLMNTLTTLGKDLAQYKTVLVLIDDAQNYEEIKTIFMTFRQVLSDELVVKTNFLFGLACTPKAYMQFMTERNHPIGRYFTQIRLGNLSEENVTNLILKNLNNTGVTFPKKTIKRVYETTKGQPFEVQVYCYQLYEKQLKGNLTPEQQELAEQATIQMLGQKIFDGWLSYASESEKEVLKIVAEFNHPVAVKALHKRLKSKEDTLNKYLERLSDKNLLEKPQRGHYLVSDYFFRAYLIMPK